MSLFGVHRDNFPFPFTITNVKFIDKYLEELAVAYRRYYSDIRLKRQIDKI
jgi:hypothetical protein